MHSRSVRAWVEVDLGQLRSNFKLITQEKAPDVGFASVVKDEGYGHGLAAVSRIALESGASFLAVSNLAEAAKLRDHGVQAKILIFGERLIEELPACLDYKVSLGSSNFEVLTRVSSLAVSQGMTVPIHVKVDTGMSRYGVRWDGACDFIRRAAQLPNIRLEGIMSHFAMSDELDKSFALLQFRRFQEVMEAAQKEGIHFRYRHICNSGGLLDLPQAHLNLVRLGILPLGVYPSKVCRRIPGIKPVMAVKARITAIKELTKGDVVGYGMRYIATGYRRIAVIPVGYGDGFPRVRNEGSVLLHGKRAPIVGGVSMDAMTVDVTDIPASQIWDTVTLLGGDGDAEISIHEIAALKNSVSYDAMTGWRERLPRIYIGE